VVKIPERLFNRVMMRLDESCAAGYDGEPPRRYLGMSSVGRDCLRRTWLAYNGHEPSGQTDKSKMYRVFRMGHIIEGFVKDLLRGAGFEITGEQTEFEDFGGRFRGHCDGIVKGVTLRDHILEVKSASALNFDNMKRRGVARTKPEYAGQMQLYMGYAGLERGLFAVMNKNTQELYTERARFDRAAFEALRERARMILESVEAPPMTTGGCYFCEFSGAACRSADRCGSCANRLSLSDHPIRGMMERRGLLDCLMGGGHFCGAGESPRSGGCGSYDENKPEAGD
jgi:hypothetical protein